MDISYEWSYTASKPKLISNYFQKSFQIAQKVSTLRQEFTDVDVHATHRVRVSID